MSLELVMEPSWTSELEPPADVRRNDASSNTLARAAYTQALEDGPVLRELFTLREGLVSGGQL